MEAKSDEENIKLPSNDIHWRLVRYYIEETPDPDYQHAPKEAYERFKDLKFGIRIHWGIYSTQGMVDTSWPFLKLNYKERQNYQEVYKTWNPTGFDAKEWLDFFEKAGAKVFAFTAKHHDGFSMYDTKTRVLRRVNWIAKGGPKIEECNLAYSIMETPFGRDVVKELVEEAHKREIKIDIYFSNPDWYDADFRPYCYHPLSTPSKFLHPLRYGYVPRLKDSFRITMAPDPTEEEKARMMKRHREQLIELLTNYGKIDMICLDMWLAPEVWPELKETIKILRQIQPEVMFRARGIGNYGDYYTPERFVPGKPTNTDMPWMVIYPLARSFAYDPDGSQYKGTKWIVHNLIDATAKGGNFMVGIGPDANGKFHPEAIKQLEETGKWLKINGEAIYRTRMWKYWREGKYIRFTQSKDKENVYAFWLGELPVKFRSKILKPKKDEKIYLLGFEKELEWYIEGNELIVNIPNSIANNHLYNYSSVLKLKNPLR